MSVSGYVERRPYKRPLYRRMSIFRCAVLLIFALLVALIPVDSRWLPVAFFAALTLFSLGAGLVSIPFMDVVGKVIPPRRRGAFFGRRTFWGGLVALGGSSIVGFLLSEPGVLRFPLNVAVMFVLASFFYGLTAWSWILIKEPPSPLPSTAQQGMVDQLVMQFRRGFHALEDNAVYRRYVWVRLALIAAGWASPFLIVYAQRELGIAAGLLGLYLGVRTAGGILSNLLWGRISDGLGNRKLIIATTAVGAATPILAVAFGWLHSSVPAPTAWLSYAFALVFLAAGTFGPGSGMGLTNYLLDVAPDGQRPLYLAFTNTLFGLARFMGILGGLIVDWAGFNILFGAAATFYLIAFGLSITLAEPRD
ncbi:MAG: MFS transporter, partial [Anaerolineae bacterium]|nr:MFS transporter [Anaerolineae bacterium]